MRTSDGSLLQYSEDVVIEVRMISQVGLTGCQVEPADILKVKLIGIECNLN